MRFTGLRLLKQSTAPPASGTASLKYVPKHSPINEADIKMLETFLESRPNTLVLTGAGISTESGIPDYRSEGVGMYARSDSRPVQHMEFLRTAAVRQRYWARNHAAWPRFSNFQPNSVHHALARFEREGRISGVVTQNVDTLHSKAGSKKVVELHGSGYTVGCLNCDFTIDRHDFQQILDSFNQPVAIEGVAETTDRPDGDIEVSQKAIDAFHVPSCPSCGGLLKPRIVFFGDNVPRDRIERVTQWIRESDGLLVLGSSLLVFSGYRIVLQTCDIGLPVTIVNIGATRGDPKASIKISAKCGDIIPKLFV